MGTKKAAAKKSATRPKPRKPRKPAAAATAAAARNQAVEEMAAASGQPTKSVFDFNELAEMLGYPTDAESQRQYDIIGNLLDTFSRAIFEQLYDVLVNARLDTLGVTKTLPVNPELTPNYAQLCTLGSIQYINVPGGVIYLTSHGCVFAPGIYIEVPTAPAPTESSEQ